MPGFPLGSFRIWPSTPGPGSPASDTTSYTLGVEYYVTQDVKLNGYGWWCCPGADTASKAFRSWTADTPTTGTQVAGTDAVSGTLTAGAWNYAPLDTPVLLTAGQHYRAGVLGGGVANWYGADGSTFATDQSAGPLVLPSTANAVGNRQGSFTVGAVLAYPVFTGGSNYWLDIVVSQAVPPLTDTRTYASGREPVRQASGKEPVSSAAGTAPATEASGREP